MHNLCRLSIFGSVFRYNEPWRAGIGISKQKIWTFFILPTGWTLFKLKYEWLSNWNKKCWKQKHRTKNRKSTGVRPVLVKYHFSPVHCDVIYQYTKLFTKNDVTLYWREMVLNDNWLHASNVIVFRLPQVTIKICPMKLKCRNLETYLVWVVFNFNYILKWGNA